jgi:hypothetical protein
VEKWCVSRVRRLMRANVNYTDRSGGVADPAGVANYHFAVFGAHGLPPTTFGGAPGSGTAAQASQTRAAWFHCGG